jgi:hypothetical protein
MVGVTGFEPATPRSQSECSDQAELHPDKQLLVPKVGVEPTLQRNTILSRARLPVPPLRLSDKVYSTSYPSWCQSFFDKTYLPLNLKKDKNK